MGAHWPPKACQGLYIEQKASDWSEGAVELAIPNIFIGIIDVTMSRHIPEVLSIPLGIPKAFKHVIHVERGETGWRLFGAATSTVRTA